MSEENDEDLSAEDSDTTQPMQTLKVEQAPPMAAATTEKVITGRTWLLLLIVLVPVLGLATYLTIRAGTIDSALPLFTAALGYIGGFGMVTFFQKK